VGFPVFVFFVFCFCTILYGRIKVMGNFEERYCAVLVLYTMLLRDGGFLVGCSLFSAWVNH